MDAPQRYPLMPRNEAGHPYRDTAGNIIVVRDKHEEDDFYATHDDAVKVPEYVPEPTPEEQIEALKAQMAERDQEIEALKAQMAGMTQSPAPPPPQQH